MERRDIDAVNKYVLLETKQILDARNKAIQAGGKPRVLYVGDIFPRRYDELRVSPMVVDTGCKIFGMKVIADYRVPPNQFYITYGELKR